MNRNVILLLLCCTIVGGGFLRFYGLEWGIPKAPYWCNHYQDEAFVLALLLKMEPSDLNPHYYINPTFHYYSLLFSLKIASFFKYIKPFSSPIKLNNLGQPVEDITMDDYSRMYRVGRFLVIIESTLLVFLVFLIGRNLYHEKIGIIAAAFTAIVPALVYQSHFLVVDAPGVFWLILALFYLTTQVNSKGLKQWYIISGILIGIAIGTKYTNILFILPLFYKIYLLNKEKNTIFIKKIFNDKTFITLGIAIIVFFLTTPHAIFSFREFLYGDAHGFGGIFGRRGLLYYNAYPTNILTPFVLTTYNSLRLPLTIFAFISLFYLFYRKSISDRFLLFLIVPFYLMMIYHASPHLRHILPVLPFLMIAQARMFYDLITINRRKFIRIIAIILLTFTFCYTLLFSLSLVKRMTPIDTRIECTEWIKRRTTKDTVISLARYFPWNPPLPIEKLPAKFYVVDYNYRSLLSQKPDYFIMTEYEFRDFSYTPASESTCKDFVRRIFSEEHFKITKVFRKDFEILGITFSPKYPNMDWNPVNPEVYVLMPKF